MFLVLSPSPVLAATINVATTDPAINADGQCSLSEAIVNANDDVATHADCPAGSGADTITLASATYTLMVSNNLTGGANGLPVITSMIIIEGNGATIERSTTGGTPDFRIFYVQSQSDLTLNDITITNGAEGLGGGIFVNGGTLMVSSATFTDNVAAFSGGAIRSTTSSSLTVDNSTFSDNSSGTNGGAIASQSTLNVTDSQFSNNNANSVGGAIYLKGVNIGNITDSTFDTNTAHEGGAIYNEGDLTIAGSNFSGNSGVTYGGAIETISSLTITNSTFDANTAYNGGGVASYINNGTEMIISSSTFFNNSATNQGGGVYNRARGSIINSTFYGNSAVRGGGYAHDTGLVFTLDHTTIVNNSATLDGGGVSSSGFPGPLLRNSIVANNSGGDCRVLSQSIGGSGANLDTDGTCLSSNTWQGVTNFSTVTVGALNLGNLMDNGGLTETIELGSGSVAIDAALGCPLPGADQRGAFRPQGSSCDIGAFEVGLLPQCSIVAPISINEGDPIPSTVNCDEVFGIFGFEINQSVDPSSPAIFAQAVTFTDGDIFNSLSTLTLVNDINDGFAQSLQAPETPVTGDVILGGLTYDTDDPGVVTLNLDLLILGNISGNLLSGDVTPSTQITIVDLLLASVSGTARRETGADVTSAISVLADGASPNTTGTANGFFTFAYDEETVALDASLTVNAPGHVSCLTADLGLTDDTLNVLNPITLLAGDVDNNETVDITDGSIIVQERFLPGSTPVGTTPDLNEDGSITILDLIHVGRNFGTAGPSACQ